MEGSTPPGRRTLTPAVLGSGLFVAICGVFAITFVAARGGLQMPVAASPSLAAVASVAPSVAHPAETPWIPTRLVTPPPSLPAVTSTPIPPTVAPSTGPRATAAPEDPLFALQPCPDRPGCYQYVIQRGDTLNLIADRYAIPLTTLLALNPEIADPSVIVIGNVLYLGRDPRVRLGPCPDSIACYLYEVQPGDTLAGIASRYGYTVGSLLNANPTITDENAIYSGQVIRLIETQG